MLKPLRSCHLIRPSLPPFLVYAIMAIESLTAVVARTSVAHGAFDFQYGEQKACSMPAWSSFVPVQSLTRCSALIAAGRTTKKPTCRKSFASATMPTVAAESQDSELVGKPKILVTEKLGEGGLELLKRVADVECSYNLSKEELCAMISAYDALIVMSGTKVTREVFKASKGYLKVVGSAGLAGLDNVDLQAATEVGCLVVNASTVKTRAAAQQGIDLLGALSQNVPEGGASLKASNNKSVGVSLAKKTIAVIGLGQVGSEVARRARRLGMIVIAHDPYASADLAREIGVELVLLDEALARADFVSLHMQPSMQPTYTEKLFNDERFAKVKKGMGIINMATRGVIDERALVRALDSGLVGQATLDVFTVELPEKDSTLIRHEKVMVTRHLGSSIAEAEEGVAIEIAQSVIGYLWGELAPTALWTRVYSEVDLLQGVRAD